MEIVLNKKLVNEKRILIDDSFYKGGTKNRWAVEHKKIKNLYFFENDKRKDFMKARNSGLTQIECKIMKRLGKTYWISFSDLLILFRRQPDQEYLHIPFSFFSQFRLSRVNANIELGR